MDSFNLVKIYDKNQDNKGNFFIQFHKILLIVLFISNICTIYIIFYLNNGLNKKITKFSNIFFNISHHLISKKVLNNKYNLINNDFIEQCIKKQNDFCNSPNKYFNQQYEEFS